MCFQRDLAGYLDEDCPDVERFELEPGCCATEMGEIMTGDICGSMKDYLGCHLNSIEYIPGAPDGAMGIDCDGVWFDENGDPVDS